MYIHTMTNILRWTIFLVLAGTANASVIDITAGTLTAISQQPGGSLSNPVNGVSIFYDIMGISNGDTIEVVGSGGQQGGFGSAGGGMGEQSFQTGTVQIGAGPAVPYEFGSLGEALIISNGPFSSMFSTIAPDGTFSMNINFCGVDPTILGGYVSCEIHESFAGSGTVADTHTAFGTLTERVYTFAPPASVPEPKFAPLLLLLAVGLVIKKKERKW
jgi:hypothetical protein